MNAQRLSDRTGARALRVAASSLLALSALGAGAGATFAAPGGGGSIWTTNEPCGAPAVQNDNHYGVGETVYVRGEGFTASSAFDWAISGQPGGASGDPGAIVASGSSTTDSAGAFCLGAYVISADDWGTYTVDVAQGRTDKNDNYRVDAPAAPIDEPQDPGDETPTDDPGDGTPTDSPSQSSTEDPGDEPTTEGPGDPSPNESAVEVPADESPAQQPGSNPSSADPNPATDGNAPATGGAPTTGAAPTTGDEPTSGNQPATGAEPAKSVPSADIDAAPRYQAVLGETATGGQIELPATDTIAVSTTEDSTLLLVFILAGLAGATVLIAPSRRRQADATE